MANITYRESTTPTVPGTTTAKLTPLTNLEVDGNFKSLNDDVALKAPINSPTFTGTVVLPSTTSIGTITNIELSYVDGVTSAIQTQIDNKVGNTAVIAGAQGGTGVANTSKTITVGGNFTTSGAFTTTLTATGNTTVTLPTTGTLATLAGSETLTNKTIAGATNNVEASSLKSATTTVSVSAATAPSTGQILTATGPNTATWQNPTAVGDTAQTLTDGATINWATGVGTIATVTLAGNRTFAAPTGLTAKTYILVVNQDATGSRTITWNSVFKWGGGAIPVLSTTANAKDVFSFFSDGTNMYGSYLRGVA